MYYEPYKKKKKGRRRRGCLSRILRLALLAVVLFIVVSVASSFLMDMNLGGGGDLSVNGNLPRGWTNILLLGSDIDDGSSRTDTIIIASVSSGGQVKLTSLMRDMLVEIDGKGKHKLNAAYAYGGAELAIKTVNQTFGMNIRHYAVVDFSGFAQLVDAVGGVEVDISKAERDEINLNVRNATRDMGGRVEDVVVLNQYGEGTHLNGAQAVGYARIRSLDSDYKRAERQRTVLDAMLAKVRSTRDPVKLARFAAAALECSETNVNIAQMTAIAAKVLLNDAKMEQFRLPVEGTYESGMTNGVWAMRPDYVENQRRLITFIYGP